MRLKLICCAIVVLHAANCLSAEAVKVKQGFEEGKVTISYDLVSDKPVAVTVEGSFDDGKNWNIEMSKASGDVGKNIAPGENKQILWDPSKEGFRKFSTQGFITRVMIYENTYVEQATGMEFVFVKGDCFKAGGPPDATDSKIFYNDCVEDYYIAKHEVTNKQYRMFKPEHVSSLSGGYSGDYSGGDAKEFLNADQQPVLSLSATDARDYAKWLSDKTGKVFRLPTEGEWEFAARAGSSATRYWGEDPATICKYANIADISVKVYLGREGLLAPCDDGFGFTSPVGSFEPNAWGLYDMIGNAGEWIFVDYSRGNRPEYSFSPDENRMEFHTKQARMADVAHSDGKIDPLSKGSDLRGGSWQVGIDLSTAAASLGEIGGSAGLRLVLQK